MKRRLVIASVVAVVATVGLLPGSGLGSSAAAARGVQKIPADLAAAIHARLGAGPIRSTSATGILPGPVFGFTLALSADGRTALVGAAGANNNKGAAYVFHVSDAGSWSSTATPTAVLMNRPGSAKNQLFGLGVALSADGTTAFVAAPLVGTGAIYVFHVSTADSWASSSTPTATLTGAQATFFGGLAVTPDGATLVAGAPLYGSGVGRAYVFHASNESAWVSTSTPSATLTNAAETDTDEVGLSVAISGDGTTALISDSVDQDGSGGAFLYHVASAASWTTSSTPTATLSDTNRSYGDYLGDSVALSGDGTVAFLTAPGDSPGLVDVFHASGEAAWVSTSTPTATLTNANGALSDGLGTRLAVSADGTTALATAYGVDSDRGAAYIFHVADEGAWASSSAPSATLTNAGAHPEDQLATGALSADGATALVGAPFVNHGTGAAYVFHALDASSWASSSTPAATLTDAALNTCVVPRLKGLKLRAARAALAARRCRLGKVRKVRAREAKRGRVLSQSPKAGSSVAVGTKVSVRVGK